MTEHTKVPIAPEEYLELFKGTMSLEREAELLSQCPPNWTDEWFDEHGPTIQTYLLWLSSVACSLVYLFQAEELLLGVCLVLFTIFMVPAFVAGCLVFSAIASLVEYVELRV